jgi:hypothetical protein
VASLICGLTIALFLPREGSELACLVVLGTVTFVTWMYSARGDEGHLSRMRWALRCVSFFGNGANARTSK